MAGGEFLRGVLEKSCVAANFATYTLEANCPTPAPASFTMYLQLRADRYFLVMAMRAISMQGTSITFFNPNMNGLELFDPKSSYVFSDVPPSFDFVGGSLSAPFTLPEYPLFEPNGMIGARVFRRQAGSSETISAGDLVSLSLYGVEYFP